MILVSYNIKCEVPNKWNVLKTLTINETLIPKEYITSMFKFWCLNDFSPEDKIGYETYINGNMDMHNKM